MAGVMSPGSSRALRLDPYNLPVHYAARDNGAEGQIRNVELDRERITLRREVRGISMKIGVRVAEFAGVTMRTLPPEGEEPAAVAIMLEHRDSGLSVPLFVATEGDDAMAQWKSWARVLGVPLLIADGDGALREPYRRIGRLALGQPAPRRGRAGSRPAGGPGPRGAARPGGGPAAPPSSGGARRS